MIDREKLVGLIQDSVEGCAEYWAGRIADHLIAHGVTVREPQKPLTAEEAKSLVLWDTDKPPLLWIEYKTNKERNRYVYVATVGELYQLSQLLSSYGNNVRCWAEKPTEEERKMAKWGDKNERYYR